jgi:hypothetical protein
MSVLVFISYANYVNLLGYNIENKEKIRKNIKSLTNIFFVFYVISQEIHIISIADVSHLISVPPGFPNPPLWHILKYV